MLSSMWEWDEGANTCQDASAPAKVYCVKGSGLSLGALGGGGNSALVGPTKVSGDSRLPSEERGLWPSALSLSLLSFLLRFLYTSFHRPNSNKVNPSGTKTYETVSQNAHLSFCTSCVRHLCHAGDSPLHDLNSGFSSGLLGQQQGL